MEHLLIQCVYSRQVWHMILTSVRAAPTLAPVANDNLESWWGSTRKLIRKETRKAFDSLVILVCWQLWKQRNARVFHPATPSISASELVSRILDELREIGRAHV